MTRQPSSSPQHPEADPPGASWAIVVPNVLTGFRLGLACTFPLLPAVWRLPVVVTAAISDGLDGWIARRFRGTSWLGGLLDALADKAFVLIVLVNAFLEQHLTLGQVILVLPRDIAVAGAAVVAATGRRWDLFQRVPARLFGKLTTVFVFGLLAVLVAEPLWPDVAPAIPPLHALAAAMSTIAAIDYTVFAAKLWRRDNL